MGSEKQRGNTTKLKPWKPGQSGNPKGRPPKPHCIPDILKAIGAQPLPKDLEAVLRKKMPGLPDKPTHIQALMVATYSRALAGQPWAVQFVAERTEGKSIQPVDLTTHEPVRILIERVEANAGNQNSTAPGPG